MRVNRILIVLTCLMGVVAFAEDEKDKEKEREQIRQMSQDTLARLYKAQPSSKAAVEKAYRYAVFSNTNGEKRGLVSSGSPTFQHDPPVQRLRRPCVVTVELREPLDLLR